MTERADEGRHQPGSGRNWEESYSFDFAARDGALGGYVRLGLRPGEGVGWYWAAFVSGGRGPHPPLVLVRDHDVPLPRGRTLEVRTSGLWADHTCETPLEHWTIGVEAFGVALDDPAEAFGGERGDLCPLGFDLEWEALDVARPGGAAGANLGSDYEQPCTVHGEVLVGSERLELDGVGWRTHRWGDRDWWAGGAAETRAGGAAETPAGGAAETWAGGAAETRAGGAAETRAGGAAEPWAGGAVETWAGGHFDDGRHFATTDAEAVADGGLIRAATLAGLGLSASPLAHAPVAVPGPGGRISRLDRALCRYESSDGRGAVGWVELLSGP